MKRKVSNAEMKEIYETKISDARWIAYDIPGNIGWILYFVGLVFSFVLMALTTVWQYDMILSQTQY